MKIITACMMVVCLLLAGLFLFSLLGKLTVELVAYYMLMKLCWSGFTFLSQQAKKGA
jgi:hypothetical protein